MIVDCTTIQLSINVYIGHHVRKKNYHDTAFGFIIPHRMRKLYLICTTMKSKTHNNNLCGVCLVSAKRIVLQNENAKTASTPFLGNYPHYCVSRHKTAQHHKYITSTSNNHIKISPLHQTSHPSTSIIVIV